MSDGTQAPRGAAGQADPVLRRVADSLRDKGLRGTVERAAARAALTRDTLVLEIGTAQGGTLFLLSRVAAGDAKLLTVDLPGGPFGSGYQSDWLPVLKAMPLPGQRFKAVRGDSHDAGTRNQVAKWFGGGPVDFALIDGDHRYEGVRRDFELYGRLVRPGGWIAFHDIVPGDEEMVGGVPRFWQELKERMPVTKELVDDWEQGGWGLGLCRVPEEGIQPGVS